MAEHLLQIQSLFRTDYQAREHGQRLLPLIQRRPSKRCPKGTRHRLCSAQGRLHASKRGSLERNSKLLRSMEKSGEALLHGLKTTKATALALPVVEQCGERALLFSTPRVRTPVALGRVCGRVHVLEQTLYLPKGAVAEVTLVVHAIERVARVPGFVARVLVVPPDLLVREDALRVTLAHPVVDAVAVDVGAASTGAALEVVGETTGRDEFAVAARADHLCAAVGARVQVLRRRQRVQRSDGVHPAVPG